MAAKWLNKEPNPSSVDFINAIDPKRSSSQMELCSLMACCAGRDHPCVDTPRQPLMRIAFDMERLLEARSRHYVIVGANRLRWSACLDRLC